MVHCLEVGCSITKCKGRAAFDKLPEDKKKTGRRGSQRSNGRANYRIPRTVLCVTTILNQTTTSTNLRYAKFCSCNSHSQTKQCVVFLLSFSLQRLQFLMPGWLWENTAIFTANAGKSRVGSYMLEEGFFFFFNTHFYCISHTHMKFTNTQLSLTLS